MGNPFTRRHILALGAGLAAGPLARAAEQTPDQIAFQQLLRGVHF